MFPIITGEFPDISVSAFFVADRIDINGKIFRSGFFQYTHTCFYYERIHDAFVGAERIQVKLGELPVAPALGLVMPEDRTVLIKHYRLRHTLHSVLDISAHQ